MSAVASPKLRQRADYTHKFNAKTSRHGWLRLTPAYSVKIVEEIIGRYREPLRVLDPFCGTATTALSAAYHGHEGVTMDINPFLVWLGRAKMARYSKTLIACTRETCAKVIHDVKNGAIEPASAPPIHNIDRWWSPEALKFLCTLRSAIDTEAGRKPLVQALLLTAFCRTLIGISNAAFNHQSISFANHRQLSMPMDMDMGRIFSEEVQLALQGAADNPSGSGRVIKGDARNFPGELKGPFDLVITSPPYANRMSYIRELRPYMYWLGFLDNGRTAGELDWAAIGGTWGAATSRLSDWEPPEKTFRHSRLDAVLQKISAQQHKSGKILANYVAKYFADMWEHFNSLTGVLAEGGEVHYIVGNSSFYGILISVEEIYAAMLEQLGFEEIKQRAIRKRNSKKELFEFEVSARWPGGRRSRRTAGREGSPSTH